MDQQIETIKKSILEFVERGEGTAPDAVLEKLGELERLVVSKDVVLRTKCGGCVKRLAEATGVDERCKREAKRLMESWTAKFSAKQPTTTPSSSSSSATATSEESERKRAKVETEKKIEPSLLPPLPLPKDAKRQKTVSLVVQIFKEDEEFGLDVRERRGVEIEQAMSEALPEASEYNAKYRSLQFNLSKNRQLRLQVLDGVVEATQLVRMTAAELADESLRTQLAKSLDDLFNSKRSDWQDANREAIMTAAGVNANAKGMFKCGRCQSYKTDHYQKQTRSADEPMTVFVRCLDCGNRWRF